MSLDNFLYSSSAEDLDYPNIRPTLDLNFIRNQQVPPFVNVTRNSQTTYVDKFGILRTANINQPVFEWDPITGECLGARIWGVVTNLRIQSEDFVNVASGGAWSFLGGDTATQNQTLSPANTLMADLITEGATSGGGHGVGQLHSFTSGVRYTSSVFAKEYTGAKRYVSFLFYPAAFGSYNFAIADVATGQFYSVSSGVTVGSQLYANGFRRVWATCNATATTTSEVHIRITSSTTDPYGNQLGNSANGMYLWGAQVNPGTIAPYVPTTATTASSTADVWSITGADAARIINITQGTLYADFATGSAVPANFFPSPLQLQGANRQNEVQIYATTGAVAYLIRTSNVVQAEATLLMVTQNGVKSAFRYDENNSRSYANGSPLFLDTVCTMPTTDRIFIGNNSGSENFLNGYIRRLTIYPKRLTDSQLKALTR